MYGVLGKGIGVLLGLWMLVLHPYGYAQQVSEDVHLQVFSTIDRAIVTIGEALIVEVEALATPSTWEVAQAVERAFSAGKFEADPTGLALVRVEDSSSRVDQGIIAPLTLKRRFIYRAQQAGRLDIPSYQFQWGKQSFETAPDKLTAYEVGDEFYQAASSIFPIIAEQEGRTSRQNVTRVGSAFFLAPDVLATSLHVVMDAQRVRVVLPSGKQVTTRKAWVADPTRDLVLLYIDPVTMKKEGVRPLQLVSEVEMYADKQGKEAVFTYGWPGGVQQSTAGICFQDVSLRPGERHWISANPVRPGDSGGPLLDRHGRVLGIVSSGTVGADRPSSLRSEVTISFDLRPALAQKVQLEGPRSIRSLMRDPGFTNQPHTQAIRLTALLSTGRRRIPDLGTSLARLDGASSLIEDDARLHFLRGVVYHLVGLNSTTTSPQRSRLAFDHAARAYRESLDVFGGHFMASYMLAGHHLRNDELEVAEYLFRQTKRYEPYVHFATYGLARTLMARLRYDEAIPMLRLVLQQDPTFGPALYDLGISYLALEDVTRAVQLVAKTERSSPAIARRLQRVIEQPVLHPSRITELPRADVYQMGQNRQK